MSQVINKKNIQAFSILKYTFGIIPIISGLDKFSNFLTNWGKYIPEFVLSILPYSTQILMLMGVIEITSGIILIVRPVIGGWIGAILLTIIGISLIITGRYLDDALRIFAMAIGCYFIARNAGSFK